MLTGNRGLCGGYNGNAIRLGVKTRERLLEEAKTVQVEVSGKRGISGFEFRNLTVDQQFLQFNDQPQYAEVVEIANRYLREYAAGNLDRLEVTYTKFHTVAKQEIVT